MRWLKTIQTVLREEPETWLAYVIGQQFETLSHLKEAKPRYEGAALRLAVFFYRLVQGSRPSRRPFRLGRHDILVYAGSANQRDSLGATVDALARKGSPSLALAEPVVITSDEHKQRYQLLRFGPLEVAKTVLLMLLRYRALRRHLRSGHIRLISWKLDTFYYAYGYLAYFERVLREVRPTLVLLSNDHNVSNRCLIAMARVMGIKTAYVQHASVSSIFPALSFDYSFLDGTAALECYQQCEANRPSDAKLPTYRHVFLTGQKKSLPGRRHDPTEVIGLALNALDAPDHVPHVLDALNEAGCRLCVRWHPGLAGRKLEPLMAVLWEHPQVEHSNPREEPVGQFLGRVDGLIAGNSSIHLEAALSGIVPVYYEISVSDMPDYYGYVRHKVSYKADTVDDLVRLARQIQDGQLFLNFDAIRHYSTTFGTEWEGREGELVAEHLMALLAGRKPTSLWGHRELANSPDNWTSEPLVLRTRETSRKQTVQAHANWTRPGISEDSKP